MDDLEEEQGKVKELKAEIKAYISAREGRINTINKLKAENKRLNAMHVKDKDGLYDEVKELQAELSKFQSGNAKEYVDKLKAEKVRLMEQVNSNRGNSSSSHTIQKKIEEYMSHNPKSKGVRLFLLPIESFDGNGIYDANYGDVYYSDGIE